MGEKQTALKNLSKIEKRTGRPKGSKDKFTNLKQAFLDAFEAIGGTDALTAWAKKESNRKAFYSMITKLLPREVDVGQQKDNPLEIKMTWFPPEPKTIQEWEDQIKRSNAAANK